jgi:nucleoside-diphosphate-sugar epimerase
MMYMDDAVRATLELMEAPAEAVKERHAYNLAGVSFTPREIAAAIEAELPGFEIDYAPDFRQAIADSWPASIDDSAAEADWGWKASFDLRDIVRDMLSQLRAKGLGDSPRAR